MSILNAILFVLPIIFIAFAFMGAYHAIKDDIEDHRLD